MGDVVLATSLLHTLHKAMPKARLSLLIKKEHASLFTNHPYLDEVIEDWYSEGKIHSREDVKRYVTYLREKHFDVAINLLFHPNPYVELARKAHIPYRIGDKSVLAQGWQQNKGVYLNWKNFLRHEIEYLHDLLPPLGINVSMTPHDIKMHIPVPVTLEQEALRMLSAHGFIMGQNKIIIIHPGVGGGNKPWLPSRFIEVIHALYEEVQAKFILTGAPSEQTLCQEIISNSISIGVPPQHLLNASILNASGNQSLLGLAALIKRGDLYIGADTGITHLASALGVSVAAIFPAKLPKPARWGPWGTRHLVVRPIISCKEGCHPRICPLDICQQDISTEMVLAAAHELLKGGGTSHRQATFQDWCKKTLNVLWLVGNIPEKDLPEWQTLLVQLQQENYHITLYHPNPEHPLLQTAMKLNMPTDSFPLRLNRRTYQALTTLIIKEDINLFHYLSRPRHLITEITRLASATKLPNAPLALRIDTPPPNTDALLNTYLKQIQGRQYANT